MWKTLNLDPALIRNAQRMRWHGYPQQLSAAWEQPVAGWDGPEWMTVPGARLASLTTSRIPKNPTPKASIKNQFGALSEEGSVEESEPPHRSSCGCSEACEGMKVNPVDAVKMPSRNKLKAARRMKAFEESGEHAMETLQKEKTKPIPKKKVKWIVEDGQVTVVATTVAAPSYRDMIQNQKEEPSVVHVERNCSKLRALSDACTNSLSVKSPEAVAWPGFKVFAEKRPRSLRPLAGAGEGDWEYLEAIIDSGATVTVIPLHVGREYEVVPGEASK